MIRTERWNKLAYETLTLILLIFLPAFSCFRIQWGRKAQRTFRNVIINRKGLMTPFFRVCVCGRSWTHRCILQSKYESNKRSRRRKRRLTRRKLLFRFIGRRTPRTNWLQCQKGPAYRQPPSCSCDLASTSCYVDVVVRYAVYFICNVDASPLKSWRHPRKSNIA